MIKIIGWRKLVDKPNRVYWENKKLGKLMNVEKMAGYWYITYGNKGGDLKNVHPGFRASKSTVMKKAESVMKSLSKGRKK